MKLIYRPRLLGSSVFIGLGLLLLISCRKDQTGPAFQVAPANYRLSEVLTFDSSGNETLLWKVKYNDQGLIDESHLPGNEVSVYNDKGQLIRSNWPGRPYQVRYTYYDNGLLDSIITEGHPVWNLKYSLLYHGQDLFRIEKINFGRLEGWYEFSPVVGDEFTMSYFEIDEFGGESQRNLIRVSLDKGHSPYPPEYRIKYGWPDYGSTLDITSYVTERNVLFKTTIDSAGQVDTLDSFTYEYDPFGYPLTKMFQQGFHQIFSYKE